MINTGGNPNTCSVHCAHFLVINGVVFTFMGILLLVLGGGVSDSIFPLIGGCFLAIGLLSLILGIVLYCKQKRLTRQAMEQQQAMGPVVVGYNPGQEMVSRHTPSNQGQYPSPSAPYSYQAAPHEYPPPAYNTVMGR